MKHRLLLCVIVLLALFVSVSVFATEIHDAVLDGDIAKIKAILAKNPKAAEEQKELFGTPLRTAVGLDDRDIIHALLDAKVDVNGKSSSGETALFAGLTKETAELLVSRGADVNAKDDGGNTPMHVAALMGRVEVLECLIAHKADMNVANNDGDSPLDYVAGLSEDEDAKRGAEFLMAHGGKKLKAEPEIQVDVTAAGLATATKGADEKAIAKILQTDPALATSKDEEGTPPLYWAAYGPVKIMQMLIDAGADIRATDKGGDTPLHNAQTRETAKLLIDAGADVKAQNNDTTTPLHRAASSGKDEVVSLLLEHGADINAVGYGGDFPLDSAILGKHPTTVALIRQKGGTGRIEKQTARLEGLAEACATGDLVGVKELVDNEPALVFVSGGNGDTLLHIAAAKGQTEVAKFLLSRSADVNAADKQGVAPLHAAALSGKSDLVQLLLEWDADANAKTAEGLTARDVANRANKGDELVQLLLDAEKNSKP